MSEQNEDQIEAMLLAGPPPERPPDGVMTVEFAAWQAAVLRRGLRIVTDGFRAGRITREEYLEVAIPALRATAKIAAMLTPPDRAGVN